jgi:RHS repeat-associated protein
MSGSVVATYAYNSFGVPLSSNSTSPANPFTYTGREFDAKSGLYYYRSRYYAPDQGRFLAEDPVAHINAYAYTQNDPVNFGDPSGALAIETALLSQVYTANLHNAQCLSGLAAAVGQVAGAAVVAGLDQAGPPTAAVQAALRATTTAELRSCAMGAVLDAAGAAAAASAASGAGGVARSVVYRASTAARIRACS